MSSSDVEQSRVVDDALKLVDAPEIWVQELRDGSKISVIAHSRSIEGTDVVFNLFFEGEPVKVVPSLRIPLVLFPEDYDLY